MSVLRVPGAELYHERRGDGPVLLFIPGGNGDAGSYEPVATALADRFTTVAYDRRGFSRSPVEDAVVDDERLATDAEDAKRLLDACTDQPAYVFGSSSGAIVALELLTRHPDRIRRLVAHEPPSVTLLPDAARHLQFVDTVYATYRADGLEAAMAEFVGGSGLDGEARVAPSPEILERMKHNLRFWLEHELRTYPRATPDLTALAADRLVLAGGRESRDGFPYWPNQVIAERLGSTIVDFPGGHVGYQSHPEEFATQLAGVLDVR